MRSNFVSYLDLHLAQQLGDLGHSWNYHIPRPVDFFHCFYNYLLKLCNEKIETLKLWWKYITFLRDFTHNCRLFHCKMHVASIDLAWNLDFANFSSIFHLCCLTAKHFRKQHPEDHIFIRSYYLNNINSCQPILDF